MSPRPQASIADAGVREHGARELFLREQEDVARGGAQQRVDGLRALGVGRGGELRPAAEDRPRVDGGGVARRADREAQVAVDGARRRAHPAEHRAGRDDRAADQSRRRGLCSRAWRGVRWPRRDGIGLPGCANRRTRPIPAGAGFGRVRRHDGLVRGRRRLRLARGLHLQRQRLAPRPSRASVGNTVMRARRSSRRAFRAPRRPSAAACRSVRCCRARRT